MNRSNREIVRFTSFVDWVSFGNYYMSAFCGNLLYKGGSEELNPIPNGNSSQTTTTRVIGIKRDWRILQKIINYIFILPLLFLTQISIVHLFLNYWGTI